MKRFKNFPKFIALTNRGIRIQMQVCVISPNSFMKTTKCCEYFNYGIVESFHLTPFNRSHQLTYNFLHFVPLGEYICKVWEIMYYQHLLIKSILLIYLLMCLWTIFLSYNIGFMGTRPCPSWPSWYPYRQWQFLTETQLIFVELLRRIRKVQ